jgi:general secretion pathway protein G
MIYLRKIHSAQGFTLVELMITLAIIGVLASIAIPAYQDYTEKAKIFQAAQEIGGMQAKITHYFNEERAYPESLADIGESGRLDPWGEAYIYYNIDKYGKGHARKDKNENPINSDFDLFSKGKNLDYHSQVSKDLSLDDVIRAHDGSFIDLAANF